MDVEAGRAGRGEIEGAEHDDEDDEKLSFPVVPQPSVGDVDESKLVVVIVGSRFFENFNPFSTSFFASLTISVLGFF